MDVRNALISLFGVTALTAGAGTVTCLNTMDDPAGQSSLTNGVHWTDAANWTPGVTSGTGFWTGWQQPDPEADFVLAHGHVVRTPRFEKFRFAARSLKIGEGTSGQATLANGNPNADSVYAFPPTTLEYGTFSNYYGCQVDVYGDFTVTAQPQANGSPRMTMGTNNQIAPPKASFVFHDTFSGAAGTVVQLVVTSYKDADPYNNCPSTNSVYRFPCDLRACRSTFRVRPWTNKNRNVLVPGDTRSYNVPRRVTFSVTSETRSPMPGAVETWSGGAIELFDAGTRFSVATLDLSGNDQIDVACDLSNGTGGLLAATAAYTHRHFGRTIVRARPVGADAGQALRIPVLKVPQGAALDPADFVLADETFLAHPTLALSVADDADGCPTLWLSRGAVVTLTAADANNVAESFRRGDKWNAATPIIQRWSDDAWPSAGKAYVVSGGTTLRSPNMANDAETGNKNVRDYAFLGDSLTLANGATFAMRALGSIEMADLRLVSNTSEARLSHFSNGTTGLWPYNQCGLCTVRGHATFQTSPEKSLQFRLSNDRGLKWDMDFAGSGNWTVIGYCETNSKNPPNGHHWFSALNTNAFTKRVLLRYEANTWPAAVSATKTDVKVPNFDYNCHVYIDDPRSLGGTLPQFYANALEIRDYSTLQPTKSMAFSDPTRGVQIGTAGVANSAPVAQVVVTNGLELGFFVPMNWSAADAALYKRGAGTLALGAAPTFAGGTDGCPRAGAANRIHVCEGALRVASATACDGLQLVFSNATKLVVSPDLADAGFRAYGLLNNKFRRGRTSPAYAADFAGDPIELAGADALDVVLEGLGDNPPKSVAFLTVGAEYADALAAKLRLANPCPGYACEISRQTVDAPSGGGSLVTFAANFSRGFLLLVR